jgi:hypothetical protein
MQLEKCIFPAIRWYLNMNTLTKMTGEAEIWYSLASVLPWNTEPGGLSARVICPAPGGIESEKEKVARRRDGREQQSCEGSRLQVNSAIYRRVVYR